MLSYTRKCFEDSSIHGLKYLVSSRISDKIFWLTSLALSVIACTLLIMKLITKLQTYPIVIYLKENTVSVTEIQFPSVTLCPTLNLDIEDFNYEMTADSIRNGDLLFSNLSIDVQKMLQVINLIGNDATFNDKNESISTADFIDVLRKFPNFWKDRDGKFSLFRREIVWNEMFATEFHEILTRWGLCYSFNIINSTQLFNLEQVSSDFHYEMFISTGTMTSLNIQTANVMDEPNPMGTRSFELGLVASLVDVDEKHRFEDDFIFNRYKNPLSIFDGFHLIFHDPKELPDLNSVHHYTVPGQNLMFWITPHLTIIEDSLKDLAINERSCYLEHEKKLKFFKIYSQNNCEQECLSNYTLKLCNCVQFFMMRNETTRICGSTDRTCFEHAENLFKDAPLKACECYRLCENLKYEVQKQALDFIGDDSITKTMDHFPSEFIVLFKSREFFPLVLRKQLENLDYLSYIGGLLGLFAGISMLSIIEVFYYSSVQILVNYFIHQRGNKVHSMSADDRQSSFGFGKNLNIYLQKLSFLQHLMIHSMNFIIDISRSFFERFFWLVMLTLSLFFCGSNIEKLYEKLLHNPISVSLSDQPFSIDQLPFPAITFASDLIFDDYRYFYIVEESFQIDESIRDGYSYLWMTDDQDGLDLLTQILVCRNQVLHDWLYDFYNLSINLRDNIRRTAETNWIESGSFVWHDGIKTTEVSLAPILMKRGVAFNFNILNAPELLKLSNVSHHYHYDRNINQNRSSYILEYPLKGGIDKSLEIKLKRGKLDPIIKCRHNAFIVHSPFELPLISKDYEFCEFAYGLSLEVLIEPEVIISDEYLMSRYTKEERYCIFDEDVSLTYFKVYTQKNCEIECLTKTVIKSCGCVPFYLISEENISTCSTPHMKCVKFHEFYALQDRDLFNVYRSCSCMPACNSVKYNYEIITRKIQNQSHDEISIKFKFKDSHCTSYRRYQQFTVLEFISESGGILGVLAGSSLLSIVELIYFCTIRNISNFVRFLTRKKRSIK